MSRHDPVVTLQQMRDHAQEAIDLARGRTRADLDQDRMLDLSLTRLLEIVGEAVTHVAREERAKYPAVEWRAVIGLRNRIIHSYDRVDFDVVWEVVTTDLPALVRELDAILGAP